jgi:hypothetical protein
VPPLGIVYERDQSFACRLLIHRDIRRQWAAEREYEGSRWCLRWAHALPGHRAFRKHAPVDPRIDLERLKKSLGNNFPKGPEAENKAWYRMFKEEEAAPEVQHIHREFLLMRDYAGFSALFLVGLGVASFVS